VHLRFDVCYPHDAEFQNQRASIPCGCFKVFKPAQRGMLGAKHESSSPQIMPKVLFKKYYSQ
jgi:hypothetical protein